MKKPNKYFRISQVIIILVLSFCFFRNEISISCIPNYYGILTSLQDFFMFLSSVLLTLFGINSFFPDNRFIKNIKILNVDLLLMKNLFNLSISSIVIAFLPSLLTVFGEDDNSVWGRISLVGAIIVVLLFFTEVGRLILRLKSMTDGVISSEKESRRK